MKEKLKLYSNLANHSDIETMGLWEQVHSMENIHCVCSVVEDPETREDVVLLFHDRPEFDGEKVWDDVDEKEYTIPNRVGSLIEGLRYWYTIGKSEKGKLYVHNAMGYDKPILEKVMEKCKIPNDKWVDTFIQSKLQWFDRPAVKGAQGVHGLNPYGVRFGIKKPPVTEWKVMTPYILHRVIEDCSIQKRTSLYLAKEAELLGAMGLDFTDCMKMEQEYVLTCQEQEVYGAKVDIEHMNKCVETWDERCHFLEKEIEPKLPPTVKAWSSTKIGRKEMASLMGYSDKVVAKVVDTTHQVKRNGETITDIVKPYYKPTTKWTVSKKTNSYSGFNISYGESPSYIKKKDLTDWIKANNPDTKPKDWDIEKEEVVKELLNSNTCKYFDVDPEDVGLIGGAFTRVKFEKSTLSQHEVVKGFLIKSGIKTVKEWNLKKDDNGIVKAEHNTTVHYPPKASYENQLHFDIKKGEAMVTSPKIGEKDYKQLTDDTGKKVGEYNTTMHRRRTICNPNDYEKGLLNNTRPDGRLPCGVNASSTGTLRSSHRNWVNIAGAGSMYGEEMRRIIVAPEGRKLISSDMNSAQLSIAAYYANNHDYFTSVCYGQEFKVDDKGNEVIHPESGEPWYLGESGHCSNSRAFELFSKAESDEAVRTQNQDEIHRLGLLRKRSKAGTFGTIFGCSGKKLAQMLDLPEEIGNNKKNAFLQNIGLDRPIQILEAMCDKNKRGRGGYIELPFGYYAFCSSPHARFNYLDQGTEAACQKWAELYFHRESKRLGLDVHRILSYHDEYTVECADDVVDDVKDIMNKSYFEASIALWEWHKKHSKWFRGSDLPSFHIELNAGCKVGSNYWDIH